MKRPPRPKRQKKGDRLRNPDSTAKEISCDYAVAPLDRAARDMDRKWGIDRLPELVSTTTAQKYGESIAKLNEALSANDPDAVAAWAGVCIRGLAFMDNEAETNGAPKANGEAWEYDLDGFKFAIIHDGAEWQTLKAKRPDLQFYTMREIAIAIKALAERIPAIDEIKSIDAGAQISNVKKEPSGYWNHGDVIPF